MGKILSSEDNEMGLFLALVLDYFNEDSNDPAIEAIYKIISWDTIDAPCTSCDWFSKA